MMEPTATQRSSQGHSRHMKTEQFQIISLHCKKLWENVLFSLLCYKSRKKKILEGTVTTTKSVKSCRESSWGWEICSDTREDIQGIMTPIVKDFAHLSLPFFSAQIPNSGAGMMTAMIPEITVYYLFSI